jgi:class 3 adenylate cyclase
MNATPHGSTELLHGTVTLFFTDLEASTELLRAEGEEQYSSILDRHHDLLRRAVAEGGGREVDSRGEELFAVFARAADAVGAAIAIEREQEHVDWPGGVSVRVRIGIHTGSPLVHGETYLGLDVHRAARICAAAHGGQILLSQPTADLLDASFGMSTRDLGAFELKGLGKPEHIFQVVAPELQTEFPEPNAASAEQGRFAADERETLGRAARAAMTAPPTRHRSRLRLGRGRAGEDYGELAWEARTLIPVASEGERSAVATLATELFDAARLAGDADRFVRAIDRKKFDRLLNEYREMAAVSKRADQEADALSARIGLVESVEAQRLGLDSLRKDVAEALDCVAGGEGSADAETVSMELRERLRGLRALVEQAHGAIGPLGMKLKRTRHHGVFKHGRTYVVPESDELGIESHREFATLQEASEHRKMLDLQTHGKRKLPGAPHDYGDSYQGYMPVRDDKR